MLNRVIYTSHTACTSLAHKSVHAMHQRKKKIQCKGPTRYQDTIRSLCCSFYCLSQHTQYAAESISTYQSRIALVSISTLSSS